MTKDERISAARAVFEAGGTFADLANKLGVCLNYARNIAEEARVNLSPKRLKAPKVDPRAVRKAARDAIRTQALEMLVEGKTRAQVAEAVGVSYNCVCMWVRLAGVEARRQARVPKQRRSWVANSAQLRILAHLFHYPDQPLTEVAVAHACSRQYVHQIKTFMQANDIHK